MELESKMSFLSNIFRVELLVVDYQLGLVADCIWARSVDSCLACVSEYLMNIVEFAAVVVKAC